MDDPAYWHSWLCIIASHSGPSFWPIVDLSIEVMPRPWLDYNFYLASWLTFGDFKKHTAMLWAALWIDPNGNELRTPSSDSHQGTESSHNYMSLDLDLSPSELWDAISVLVDTLFAALWETLWEEHLDKSCLYSWSTESVT